MYVCMLSWNCLLAEPPKCMYTVFSMKSYQFLFHSFKTE